MKKISFYLFCLFAFFSFSFAEVESKIAYLKADFHFDDANNFYVGQNLSIKYNLTLLSNAFVESESFMDIGKDSGVDVLNKDAKWQQNSDGSMSKTYVFKITAQNFAIPPLEVIAANDSIRESVIANGIKLQAIELKHNKNYINLIANSFEVVDYKAYDDGDRNILIFQFESSGGNVNNIHLADFKEQGLKHNNLIDGINYGNYYVFLDKHIKSITMDYFNLKTKQFVSIEIPIRIAHKQIQEEVGDIKPRNTLLIFKNLMLGGAICVFVIIAFVFKKIRKISFVFIVLLGIALVYSLIFNFTSGVANVGANISIIPTHNSTIMQTLKEPKKVSIIGEYNDYYKVILDDKVGWIRKEYVSKN